MAKCVKPVLTMLASQFKCLFESQLPCMHFSFLLLHLGRWSTWVPATQVGDQCGVLGSWLFPCLLLAVATIWRLNWEVEDQWIDIPLSPLNAVYLFFSSCHCIAPINKSIFKKNTEDITSSILHHCQLILKVQKCKIVFGYVLLFKDARSA